MLSAQLDFLTHHRNPIYLTKPRRTSQFQRCQQHRDVLKSRTNTFVFLFLEDWSAQLWSAETCNSPRIRPEKRDSLSHIKYNCVSFGPFSKRLHAFFWWPISVVIVFWDWGRDPQWIFTLRWFNGTGDCSAVHNLINRNMEEAGFAICSWWNLHKRKDVRTWLNRKWNVRHWFPDVLLGRDLFFVLASNCFALILKNASQAVFRVPVRIVCLFWKGNSDRKLEISLMCFGYWWFLEWRTKRKLNRGGAEGGWARALSLSCLKRKMSQKYISWVMKRSFGVKEKQMRQ